MKKIYKVIVPLFLAVSIMGNIGLGAYVAKTHNTNSEKVETCEAKHLEYENQITQLQSDLAVKEETVIEQSKKIGELQNEITELKKK